MVLLGDLFVTSGEMVAGVTVSAAIVLRDNQGPLSEKEANERGKVLAPWVNHALYDTAAREARKALAGVEQDPSVVPHQTPEFRFTADE